jgi:hypothetical protein
VYGSTMPRMPDSEDLGLVEDDDDEVAVEWDENAGWPLENDEPDDDDWVLVILLVVVGLYPFVLR